MLEVLQDWSIPKGTKNDKITADTPKNTTESRPRRTRDDRLS
jgi:hypothetical protein